MKNDNPKLQEDVYGYKTEALYYKKCLEELRDTWVQNKGACKNDHHGLSTLCGIQIENFDEILEHEHAPPGVSLDKPNYGMF